MQERVGSEYSICVCVTAAVHLCFGKDRKVLRLAFYRDLRFDKGSPLFNVEVKDAARFDENV